MTHPTRHHDPATSRPDRVPAPSTGARAVLTDPDLSAAVSACRVLLDGRGRLWRWDPRLPRWPGDAPGVFCHGALVRTEQEIEHDAEPIIEVRDPRVLGVRLEPVPVHRIRLNDLVVLPGLGELSLVIGLWPCPDRHRPWLYVCSDNGDWARRRADSLLLRADIPFRTTPRAGLVTPPNGVAVEAPSKIPLADALVDEEQRDG